MKKFRFLALVATVCALALSFSSCSKDEPKKDPQVENPTDDPTEEPEVISLDGKVYEFQKSKKGSDGTTTYTYRFTFKDKQVELYFEAENPRGGGGNTHEYKYVVNPENYHIELTPSAKEGSPAFKGAKKVLSKLKKFIVTKELTEIIYEGNISIISDEEMQLVTLKLKK